MNKLQREAVIRTALELLNDVGMEGLTTRRLAEPYTSDPPQFSVQAHPRPHAREV